MLVTIAIILLVLWLRSSPDSLTACFSGGFILQATPPQAAFVPHAWRPLSV